MRAASLGSGFGVKSAAKDERLTDRTVALIVKHTALVVDLDPSDLADHSLRAGLATTPAKAGKSERAIMAQTGHRRPFA